MLHGESGQSYNISSEACNIHLKEFAQLCAELNGKNVIFDLPSETERRGFSVAVNAILDNTKLNRIGFATLYTMREAIDRTVKILDN